MLEKIPDNKQDFDVSAIVCFCFTITVFNIHIAPEQVLHKIGFTKNKATAEDILLAAKIFNIKAKSAKSKWIRFGKIKKPVIASLNNGGFVVIVKADQTHVTIVDPRHPSGPLTVSKGDFEKRWDGIIIFLRPYAEPLELSGSYGFSWFYRTALLYKKTIFEIFFAAFFVQVLGVTLPIFSQLIIDKAILHHNTSTLTILGFGMLLVVLFETALTAIQNQLTIHTASRIDVIWGSRIVTHLFNLPLQYFEARRVGNIAAHVRELESIRQFVTGTATGTIIDFIFFGVFIAVMAAYSWKLTFIVVLTLPVFLSIPLIIRPTVQRRLDQKFDRGAESQAFMIESLTGIHTIKALAIEAKMISKWQDLLARYITASYRTSMMGNIGGVLSNLIQKVSTLAILLAGANLIMNNELTVGQLIGFQMLASRVTQPIVRLSHLWNDFQQIRLSVQRLGDIMNKPIENAIGKRYISKNGIAGKFSLTSVSFIYPGIEQKKVLDGVSFQVEAGQTVGIVGRSGSGKSTLAKLLQGLYFAEAGDVTVDDINIAKCDPTWYRRLVGVVLQENFLFDGTLRENISINHPRSGMHEIVNAAKLAGIHDLIASMPQGYETKVGERGVALSGGQRQRIAIARALITNPKILIFDEATSALDSESEAIIQKNLSMISKGRTVFIIAHRLSTIQHADKIIVLDEGRVVEEGNHNDLLNQKGKYFQLFTTTVNS